MSTETVTAKRPARRRGRWTYEGQSDVPGWHLDGTPLVLDFDPLDSSCAVRGAYLLYGDTCAGRRFGGPVDHYLDGAMEWAEEHWDQDHAGKPRS